MQLTRLYFDKYKAFDQEYELEIKPITVLIGPNSSGKSAIARLPLLLARGFGGLAKAPLELEFDGMDYAASFKGIVHGHSPRMNVAIGFGFADESSNDWRVRVGLQGFEDLHLHIVSEFRLWKGKELVFEAVWDGTEPDSRKDNIYTIYPSGKTKPLPFQGLLPTPEPEDDPNDLRNLLRARFKVNYLGPFRKEPERNYRFTEELTESVGPGGSQAPKILSRGSISSKAGKKYKKVLDSVGNWFSEHLGGWKMDVEKDGSRFSLVLENPGNPSLRVNLRDVGTGVAQVLPIVVQRMFDEIWGESCFVDIVEQPELHLHPQAHGELADLFVTACRNSSSRFLIETHSELFLLRLRRRIAEKKLNCNDVAFYWIRGDDSGDKIMKISIDEAGEVDQWPTDVFSDAYKEIVAIRKAQKQQAGKGDR